MSSSMAVGPNVIVLEHPLIKVACERLNLAVRHAHKTSEKAALQMTNQFKALAKVATSSSTGAVKRKEALSALDLLARRLRNLKTAIKRGRDAEKRIIDQLKARAEFITLGEEIVNRTKALSSSTGATKLSAAPAAASDSKEKNNEKTQDNEEGEEAAAPTVDASFSSTSTAMSSDTAGSDNISAGSAMEIASGDGSGVNHNKNTNKNSNKNNSNFASSLTPSTNLGALSRWESRRLDILIVDHLLREGHFESAKCLAEQSEVSLLTDIELFENAKTILDELSQRSCTSALEWCAENKSRLKKIGSDLEFSLRFQEFVELARAGEPLAAIEYARTHLSSYAETHMAEIKRAMGLLAFAPDTRCPVYAVLYSDSRWDALSRKFQRDHNAMYSMTTVPVLAIALAAGITVLKTPSCGHPIKSDENDDDSAKKDEFEDELLARMRRSYITGDDFDLLSLPNIGAHDDGNDDNDGIDVEEKNVGNDDGNDKSDNDSGQCKKKVKNKKKEGLFGSLNDCPVCSPEVSKLAEGLPCSLHTQSRLVCRITGEVMDADNPPFVLPNGQVYSSEAIAERTDAGMFKCPTTGKKFPVRGLRRAYIL